MTRCRLILDPPADGSWNMAVDQVLLEAATAGQTILRYYGWAQPTLSLGYFQSAQDRHQHAASRTCCLVRRHSGGGAILHHHELTYCFATPAAARLAADSLRLYRVFHESLLVTLARRGIAARLCDGAVASGDPAPFLCFQRRTSGDVLLGDQKIAGSAQRRYRSALLQHGSVLLECSSYAPELPGIGQLAAAGLSAAALAADWLEPLSCAASLEPVGGTLSAAERERASQLVHTKYAHPAWTHRR